MLTDERSYSFPGLHSNYRTGDTQDVLEMLCAYLTDIWPGGELKRPLCITRVASTLVSGDTHGDAARYFSGACCLRRAGADSRA